MQQIECLYFKSPKDEYHKICPACEDMIRGAVMIVVNLHCGKVFKVCVPCMEKVLLATENIYYDCQEFKEIKKRNPNWIPRKLKKEILENIKRT